MKQILFFGNQPNSGKSTFVSTIKRQYNLVCDIVHTDSYIHNIFLKSYPNGCDINIYDENKNPLIDHILMHNLLDVDVFTDTLIKLINDSNKNLIIIEGFTLGYHFNTIFNRLNSVFENIKIVKTINENNQFYIEYDDVKYNVSNRNFDEVNKKIINDFSKYILKEHYNKIVYQCFDIIGYDCHDSLSPEKYSLSKLEQYVKEDDKFLDIGSNYGYFCFRVSNIIKNKIVGLDSGAEFIKSAKILNSRIFVKPNIEFILEDIFKYQFNNKFNVILSASIFHYFRERQQEFIDKIYSILEENGLFFLEVEMNPNQGLLKLSRLPNEVPCHFPDQNILNEMIQNKFTIIEKNISVRQKGSPNDRYFFILKKI